MAAAFEIATISNDLSTYSNMRRSMAAVGYTDSTCRFTLFDNSAKNQFEPYQVLRDLRRSGEEQYLVLCHQDLVFDEKSSFDVLSKCLSQLDAIDSRWAIAGPAGVDFRGRKLLYLDDPWGSFRTRGLPRRVASLDENFLVLRRASYVMPSDGLSGFHLFGTDLCLKAMEEKKSAYVIALPVRHLSAGKPDDESYSQSQQRLMAVWREKLLIGLIATTCSEFRVSRWRWLERFLHRRYVAGIIRRMRLPIVFLRHAQ